MELTVGANQFFWTADKWAAFYEELATVAVDRVVLGELICSKRQPFYQDRIPHAVSTLLDAGKTVLVTSLALITLKREIKLMQDLFASGMMVEINDLTALSLMPEGTSFAVGPMINVYNESTLSWLASKGASRICLPPELPLASIKVLGDTARDLDVELEVWGFGRIPLALSGRCYHARLHGRSKDNCQFACEADPDGLEVQTLEDQSFLTMNGVQVLSGSHACLAAHMEELADAGVTALRLSPQSKDFTKICGLFHRLKEGNVTAEFLTAEIGSNMPDLRLSDGFLTGQRGADWSGPPQ